MGGISKRTYAMGVIAVVALLVSVPISAQTFPTVETYFSFATAHSNYGHDRINSPGFQISGGYNPHRMVRLTGEFSAHFHGTNLVWQNQTMKLRDYQFLLGPELVFRNRSRFTPFVHAMVGYAARHYNVGTGIYECTYDDWFSRSCTEKQQTVVAENGMAMQFGGGLDIAVHPKISLRAIQVDYVRTHMSRGATPLVPDPSILPPLNNWQNHYRFGVGIVLKLGERGGSRR